jgi:RNA-directed DNA polymerase
MDAELTIEAVFDAYFDCRKTKRNSKNQLRFEADLERNLVELYYDLKDGSYEIGPSIAFIITRPKVREVWAADFRDRVVHHVIYNAISQRFHNSFISDSYACIAGRGIHYGLERVTGFARSITQSWSRPAYFLKADVANFFNAIDRHIMFDLIQKRVHEDWLLKLIRQAALHDPRTNYRPHAPRHMFEKVPRHKSLFYAAEGKGLPIGNLTSQFFANVYMNELDQFAKRVLKVKYYGRYVDDVVLFHEDPDVLNEWYERMDEFLRDMLDLHFHPNKKQINLIEKGVDFTGFIIKPGRTYLRQATIANLKQKIRGWEKNGSPVDADSLNMLSGSVNSYLGMLRQVNGYEARKALCKQVENLFVNADEECTKIWPVS